MNTWGAGDVADTLHLPTDADHKYSRGVVSLRTGSRAFPGAAVLSIEGAWRIGSGMVRWHGEPAVAQLVLQRRPETVVNASGRIDAAVIGSGVNGRSRDERVTGAFRARLRSTAPTVVDAGALDLVNDVRGPVIVTPHEAELAEVRIPLGLGIDDIDGDPLARRLRAGFAERLLVVRETAVALGGVVLLKGASTIVATPDGWWTVVRAGTPWLATAGTGDVLAGAMGGLLAGAVARRARAQRDAVDREAADAEERETLDVEELGPIAATAAWLHGAAGRLAAGQGEPGEDDDPGHPITALEVAEHLPAAYALALRSSGE